MKNIFKDERLLMATSVVIIIMMSSSINAISNGEMTDNTSISNSEMTDNTSNITYSSSIDQDYGFYRVIDITTHKQAPYDNNHTLTIYVKDTVEWINYADPDEPLTIISKDNLWGNRSAYLRWNYQKFNYTFDQSGTYDIYIKEYPRLQHQTIVVRDIPGTIKIISTPTATLTVSPTINKTEDNLSNASTVGDETHKKGNLVPAVIAVIGIMILIIYISRRK